MDVGGGQISVNGRRAASSKGRSDPALGNDYGAVRAPQREAIVKLAKLQGTYDALVIPSGLSLRSQRRPSVIEQAFSGDARRAQHADGEHPGVQMQVLQTVQQRAQELSSQQGQDPRRCNQTGSCDTSRRHNATRGHRRSLAHNLRRNKDCPAACCPRHARRATSRCSSLLRPAPQPQQGV